jgi:hypothetical protein
MPGRNGAPSRKHQPHGILQPQAPHTSYTHRGERGSNHQHAHLGSPGEALTRLQRPGCRPSHPCSEPCLPLTTQPAVGFTQTKCREGLHTPRHLAHPAEPRGEGVTGPPTSALSRWRPLGGGPTPVVSPVCPYRRHHRSVSTKLSSGHAHIPPITYQERRNHQKEGSPDHRLKHLAAGGPPTARPTPVVSPVWASRRHQQSVSTNSSSGRAYIPSSTYADRGNHQG